MHLHGARVIDRLAPAAVGARAADERQPAAVAVRPSHAPPAVKGLQHATQPPHEHHIVAHCLGQPASVSRVCVPATPPLVGDRPATLDALLLLVQVYREPGAWSDYWRRYVWSRVCSVCSGHPPPPAWFLTCRDHATHRGACAQAPCRARTRTFSSATRRCKRSTALLAKQVRAASHRCSVHHSRAAGLITCVPACACALCVRHPQRGVAAASSSRLDPPLAPVLAPQPAAVRAKPVVTPALAHQLPLRQAQPVPGQDELCQAPPPPEAALDRPTWPRQARDHDGT